MNAILPIEDIRATYSLLKMRSRPACNIGHMDFFIAIREKISQMRRHLFRQLARRDEDQDAGSLSFGVIFGYGLSSPMSIALPE